MARSWRHTAVALLCWGTLAAGVPCGHGCMSLVTPEASVFSTPTRYVWTTELGEVPIGLIGLPLTLAWVPIGLIAGLLVGVEPNESRGDAVVIWGFGPLIAALGLADPFVNVYAE